MALKTLDVMKTARVGIENGTIKPLLNNVSEGIIFVNIKVVSHINHIKSMLGDSWRGAWRGFFKANQ